jgi:glucuronoarabinoxylan endo-1,4-beta-xylanase
MDDFSGLYQVWSATIDITTDAISEQPSLPHAFDLKQNYPNPFNPSTTIEYTLTESDFVRLRVLDINAKELALIVNERQSAGSHQAVFNTENLNLASGTYFYQLSVGSHSLTRSMVLLR